MGTGNNIVSYFARIGIAVSVLANVILGGPSNQTFSARNYAWKKRKKPNIVWMIDNLFFWENSHCLTSWVYWYTRHHANSSFTNHNYTPSEDLPNE